MKKDTRVSALFWSSADKIVTNGFALIISIILARLIAPSEYGVIATAQIFTVLLSLFVEPGMTSALIQKKDSDDLDFSTILTLNLLMGTGLYVILFMISGSIGEWFDLPQLCAVIRVLGLQILVCGYNSVQVAYVQKHMMFKKYFVCSITGAAIGAGIAVFMAYRGAGVWALVVYSLVKYSINALMVTLLFKIHFKLNFSRERFRIMFPFAGKMLLAKFIDQGYVEATQTIISKFYSATDLAFYNKGKSFPDLIINNLNTALASVLFPMFSNIQDNNYEFMNAVRNSIRMTTFICLPILTGMFACADSFISVVLTDKWIDCVPYLRLICCYYFWVPFSNVIWQSLKAAGKSNVILKLEIAKMILNITTLILFLFVFKSPIAVAISLVATYTISFVIENFAAVKHLNFEVKELICDFTPSFMLACVMGIIVLAVGKIGVPAILKLIIQVTVGTIIYGFTAAVLKFPQVKQLKALLAKRN